MHYDPRPNDHGLPHDPFKALVAPRPIGWISSVSPDGVANLAPYSYFQAVCDHPHLVMFSSSGVKDSQRNVEATGEFVCNLATFALREAVNLSSAPVDPSVSEFDVTELTKAPSVVVRPPRVAAAPVALECVYVKSVALAGADGREGGYTMVIGEVVHIHIDDRVIVNGIVDLTLAEPIARCGYKDYAHVASLFAMERPSG